MGKSPGVSGSSKLPPSSSTAKTSNNNSNNKKSNIHVQQPPPAQETKQQPDNTQSTYQLPGPGFEHQVTNLPGGGLAYSTVNGANPISAQQPQLHQTPGFVPPTQAPPGFFQNTTTQPSPYFATVSQNTTTQPNPYFAPASQDPITMAYQNGAMPNAGQHFQPQVPDTTYGPIMHTYHPRFDAPNAPRFGNENVGQYVTVDGRLYQVVQTAGAPGVGGAPIQYVPVQQVQPPYFVAQQAPQMAGPAPIILLNASQKNNPKSSSWAGRVRPAQGIATAPIQIAGQAPAQQPIFIQGQAAAAPNAFQPAQILGQAAPIIAQPAQIPGMFPGGAPGQVPPYGGAPDVMGIGRTGTEVQLEQYHQARNNGALEPQDIAPADTDPSRMYYCRELDGEWTLRNRFGIDHLGDCRWYVMPGGVFYAVRLAD
ncbi:hypothetical protein F5B20DRAFT_587667 [Whalleya microplaca]|nr:hypothetical protein F5B20DRAFT_587667 [Whalleya microplaca]